MLFEPNFKKNNYNLSLLLLLALICIFKAMF